MLTLSRGGPMIAVAAVGKPRLTSLSIPTTAAMITI